MAMSFSWVTSTMVFPLRRTVGEHKGVWILIRIYRRAGSSAMSTLEFEVSHGPT
jgi:hypothetical protein